MLMESPKKGAEQPRGQADEENQEYHLEESDFLRSGHGHGDFWTRSAQFAITLSRSYNISFYELGIPTATPCTGVHAGGDTTMQHYQHARTRAHV